MHLSFQERLIYFVLALPAYVLAFTLHEFGHAYTANELGDDTPRRAGKLSLDPLKMMDPMGSLFMALALLFGWPLLGWAYVPINPRNFRNPRRDHIIVSLAGPLANFVQAMAWFFLLLGLRIVARSAGVEYSAEMMLSVLNQTPDVTSLWNAAATVCSIGITLNIALGLFNLLPIPPLDGSYIAENLVPALQPLFATLRPMAFMILFVIIQIPVFQRQFWGPVDAFSDAIVVRAFGYDPQNFERSN